MQPSSTTSLPKASPQEHNKTLYHPSPPHPSRIAQQGYALATQTRTRLATLRLRNSILASMSLDLSFQRS